MKGIFLTVLLAVLPAFLAAGAALAVDVPLEKVNLGLKAGVINFTDAAAEDLDVENGPYLGMEGFYGIADRLWLGGEVGYAQSEGSIPLVETELTYIPIELNLKYAAAATPLVAFALGGGVSYNFVRLELDCLGACFAEEEDWLAGAQLFGGIHFNYPRLLLGVEGKYQVTEEDLDNWRLTGQAGYKF